LILTALVLMCCNTISGDAPRTSAIPAATSVTEINATPIPSAVRSGKVESTKPDAPLPKTTVSSNAKTDFDASGAETATPAPLPAISSPVKPATADSYESPRDRKIWYGLMFASHGAAAFDAWTTRRAIGGGYGIEGDPLQRPFANSGAIYATTQVTPLIMDYVGHRMMRSSHNWIRRGWWIPQAASASVSFGAGVHNYSIAK
jgi:hypothetical protein